MQDFNKEIIERIRELTDRQRDIVQRRVGIEEEFKELEKQISDFSNGLQDMNPKDFKDKVEEVKSGSTTLSSITFRLTEEYYRNFFSILNTLQEQCGFPVNERMVFRCMISMIHDTLEDSDFIKYILKDRAHFIDNCKKAIYKGNRTKKMKLEKADTK